MKGPSPLKFFTICARNYAAHAAALAESLTVHHSDSTFTVWLLKEGEIPGCLGGRLVRDLAEVIEPSQYWELRARYDTVEFCTALKPKVFETMFAEGAERLVYLDPDIFVYRPLEDLDPLLAEEHMGVLTAHSLSPLPHNEPGTDDFVLLRSGVFNLGFLALRKGQRTADFLQWWWSWLQTHASQDHATGLFTDQKWLGLAPAFWPELTLIRHLGYNAAFWNLHERPLSMGADGCLKAGGDNLVFFHFSGYNPTKPDRLTKYSHAEGAHPMGHGELRQLCDNYAAKLFQHGYQEVRKLTPVCLRDEGFDDISASLLPPASQSGQVPQFEEVLKFLHGYDPDATYPRYVEAVLDRRPGVRRMLRGRSLGNVADWMREYGIQEDRLSPRIVMSFHAQEPLSRRCAHPIAVLGMHRANTSLLAQMLSLQGVQMGPQFELTWSTRDNPDGYYEDMRFHRVSSDILKRFGGSWDRPPDFPSGWVNDERLSDLAETIRAIESDRENEVPWGWKDPRTCLTLPFFAEHLSGLRLVVIVRHPIEVAFSLQTRKLDTLPYEVGLELWHRYYRSLLPILDQYPSVTIHSSNLRRQPAAEVKRIVTFLGLEPSEFRIEQARRAVRAELHRSVPIDFAKLEADLSPSIASLYREMCRRSQYFEDCQAAPYSSLDSAQDRIRELEAMLAEKEADIRGARLHLNHLQCQGIQEQEPAAEVGLAAEVARLQRELAGYANLRSVRVVRRLRQIWRRA